MLCNVWLWFWSGFLVWFWSGFWSAVRVRLEKDCWTASWESVRDGVGKGCSELGPAKLRGLFVGLVLVWFWSGFGLDQNQTRLDCVRLEKDCWTLSWESVRDGVGKGCNELGPAKLRGLFVEILGLVCFWSGFGLVLVWFWSGFEKKIRR
jgi:hypothetical protein